MSSGLQFSFVYVSLLHWIQGYSLIMYKFHCQLLHKTSFRLLHFSATYCSHHHGSVIL